MTPLVEAIGINKRYGATPVLRGVDFAVREGEVHALLGGNGAGKSTLMRILSGLVPADAGRIVVAGQPVATSSPAEMQRLGLYLVPQEAQLFPNQTVLENICLGLPGAPSAYRDRVAELVGLLGVGLPLSRRASTLEIADRQIVEIMRGMIRNARVLILDEPTSALTPIEVARLFQRMRALRAAGVGLVFISHKLHELRQIADRITVLRDGAVALAAPMDRATDEQILAAMSPGLVADSAPPAVPEAAGAAERLSLQGVCGHGFADVSLTLAAGEILGLAGVVGAGRTELAEAVAGLRPITAGTMTLQGQPVDPGRWTLRRAVDRGLVLLAEDRGRNGLFLDAPLHWNLTSFVVHRLPFMLRPGRDREAFETHRQQMAIRCAGPDQPAGRLSGGNQQKVLLAKCLAANPSVLILDEPTRGVDAGARADIYGLIRGIAAAGTAVLVISSDFDEIARLSHRILVMAAGRIAGELPAGADGERIGRLAFESREAVHA